MTPATTTLGSAPVTALATPPSGTRSPSFVRELRRRGLELHDELERARERGDADAVQECLDALVDLRETALRGDVPVMLADVPELWAS